MSWGERDRKANQFSEELLESENNRMMEGVMTKVSSLKHIAVDLRDEAKDQNKLMDDSSGVFESVGSLLGNSFKRVQGMRRVRGQNCKYMCYFTLILVVLLFIAYLLFDKVLSR